MKECQNYDSLKSDTSALLKSKVFYGRASEKTPHNKICIKWDDTDSIRKERNKKITCSLSHANLNF